MKWFSKFLGKSETPPSPAPVKDRSAQAAAPGEDVAQLRSRLSGTAADAALAARLGHALAERGQAPLASDPTETWIAAICHAADKTAALDWLERVEDEDALASVAIRARSGEVRFAAARRLAGDTALERVAQASRDKDKRVHRHCADQLRQRRLAQASAQQAGEIAGQLRALLDAAPQSLTRLMEMRKAVEDLQPGPARTECTALLDEAFASLREETEAQRQLHGQVEAAKLLDAETAHAEWPWAEGLPAWRSRLAALHQSVDHPPVWLADQAKALADLLAGIDARLAGMAEDDEALAACEGYLASLETGNPGEADARAGWQALAKPRHAQARQELEHRWKSLSAALYPPPAPSRPAIKAGPAPHAADKLDKETLRALFDQLEQAIAGGHLAEGDGFARQIRNLIGGRKLDGSMETRWHALQGELERLRGWARWGTGQAREKLIADAEALLSGEHPAEELAVAVSALREEWKRLDAHAPAAKAQWESFDATLEKAYAPVAALRAEQAARREAARAAKEALCAQWEADESWREADCKTIEARRADLIRQWRAAPQAGYRDERALRKRFDPLIEAMDRHLDAARAEETARREQIILAAEALAGESDLRRAIAEAKVLQQGWNVSGTTVHLRRGDEQALWRRFRAACDAVFGRLDAERADQAARLAAQEAQRQQHLDEFAAVLAGNSDAQRVRQAMTRFQAAWDGTRPSGRERTNAPSAAQENQARALLNQARQRLDSLRQARQEARYDVLARKAALAAQVEAAVLAGQPAETALAEARQAWAALADSPAKSEKLLAERLDQAGAISAEALAAGQETREALLLDLEIALGLPSPDSVSERRRERQLARLQNRFASAPDGTADPEELVARWYATPAPNDPLAERRIASVVRHLATGSGPA